MRMLLFICLALLAHAFTCRAQCGLERVWVEIYYVSDSSDYSDTYGGVRLAPGTITYRVYADLEPRYRLQMIYGVESHPLIIASTAPFYNNPRGGQAFGSKISTYKLGTQRVALDSYITNGAASLEHFAVPLAEDDDGSIIGGAQNDGGSAKIAGGLLANFDQAMHCPLTVSDGLQPHETVSITSYNLAPDPFIAEDNAGIFTCEDSVWGLMEGAAGITESNNVLLAQITTSGQLRFELNVQLLGPEGQVQRLVARKVEAVDITHPSLIFPAAPVNAR